MLRACSALAPLALGFLTVGPAEAQGLLRNLSDVHPGSLPNTFVGTEDAKYLFLGEGGRIAVIETPNPGGASGKALMPAPLKFIEMGELGAVPADMVLDPELDFDAEWPAGANGDTHDDCVDIMYVACGQMGLWAVAVDPRPGKENRVIRLDDRGNPSMPVESQFSRRFCNQVEIVNIAGDEFVVATFARKYNSQIRFYRLAEIRELFFNGASETGSEIDPARKRKIGGRPSMNGLEASLQFSTSYVLGMSVDQDENADPAQEGVNIYLAMEADGIVRIRATDETRVYQVPLPSQVGSPSAGSNQVVVVLPKTELDWGPCFGTGSHYTDEVGGGLNDSGYPSVWYENFRVYDSTRSPRFNQLLRDDPPAFVDVLVQDSVDAGGTRQHFLYAAVDHLNWVRFDLEEAWGDEMQIDHHEGLEGQTPMDVEWRTASGATEAVPYAGGGRPQIRATNMPDTVDGLGAPVPYNGFQFARRLDLVIPPATSPSVSGPVLVVTTAGAPMLTLSDVFAPRSPYGHSFYGVGGVPLEVNKEIGSGRVATILYDTANLGTNSRGPDALASELGYHEVGGGVLWAPHDQSARTSDDILVLHDGISACHSLLGIETSGVCLSTFPLDQWVEGEPADFYQRNELTAPGRYTFGVGWCEGDPNVLYTAVNDSQEIQHDGALRIADDGTGRLRIEPIGPSPTPGVFPDTSTGDKRLVIGLAPKDDCQWLEGGFNWFVGRAENPDEANPANRIRWGLFKVAMSVTGVPTPSVVQEATWFLESAEDRWERAGRAGGYDTAATSPEGYPKPLAFFSRAGTPDSVQVVDRDELMGDTGLDPLVPSGSGSPVDWSDFWVEARLNCHPEYDLMPNDNGDPGIADAKRFWNVFKPVMGEQANTNAWAGRLIEVPHPTDPAQPSRWLFTSPCFYLTNSRIGRDKNLARTGAVDGAFGGWFSDTVLAARPRYESLVDNFDHGLVQFWDFTDPSNLTATFRTTSPTTEAPFGYPEGTSTLRPLVMEEAGSSAFELDSFTVDDGGTLRTMVVVADFGGSVQLWDITGVSETAGPERLSVWQAPERYRDEAAYLAPAAGQANGRPLGIVWSVAVDRQAGAEPIVYAGVHDYGIVPLRVVRQEQWLAPSLYSLEEDASGRIETAGNPFSVRIRPEDAAAGIPKALIASDGVGGIRLYVEED